MLRLLILLIPLLSCSCSLIRTSPRESAHGEFSLPTEPGITPLLVFSHGHHTGFTLPASAVRDELPALTEALPGQWLEFGWGDEGFYRTERVSLPLAFRALAYPTPSVMHVCASREPLHLTYTFAPARLYHLDEQQRVALIHFLSQQFQRDQDGRLIDLGPGRYGISRFYRGERSFHFPRTCNNWTAEALRSTGLAVQAVTAPGLWRQLR